jgi:hypothetical protein
MLCLYGYYSICFNAIIEASATLSFSVCVSKISKTFYGEVSRTACEMFRKEIFHTESEKSHSEHVA